MRFLEILTIAVALSFDCFAISVSRGLSRKGEQFLKDAFLFSAGYGIAHVVMLLAGWFLGYEIGRVVEKYEHWLTFFLLLMVGIKMIVEAFGSEESKVNSVSIKVAFLSLVLVTSLDAFAIGITFSFVGVDLCLASLTIASTVFLASMFGYFTGKVLKKNIEFLETFSEVVGGAILILLGVKMLLEGLGVL